MGRSEEIASLQFLIGSLRGQTQVNRENQAQQQQQQNVEGQRAFQQQQADNQRLFAEQQANASREATIARDTSRFAHEKEMFSAKPDRQQLQRDAAVTAVRSDTSIRSMANHKLLKLDEASGQLIPDAEGATQSVNQATYLSENIIELENTSDEEFELNKDGDNQRAIAMKKELEKAGFPTAIADILTIRDGESKENYTKRLKGFRDSLARREIATRKKKIASQNTVGARAPTIRNNVQEDVFKEFGITK